MNTETTHPTARYETIKGGGLRLMILPPPVGDEPEWIRLPVLGGEDVTRKPHNLMTYVCEGKLYAAEVDEPMSVEGTETLVGWGELDGPATLYQPRHCAWKVGIPERVLAHLRQHHGLADQETTTNAATA